MKKIIDVAKLRPGDIILAGYNNDQDSIAIQKEIGCPYSHAMLFWYGSVIHSTIPIVITENPSRMLYDDCDAVCVRRLKPAMGNNIRIEMLIDYARSFVGTLYDKRMLASMHLHRNGCPNPNRQMCAKLVAQCYDHVCIDLVEDYNNCTPRDFWESDELFTINDILRDVTSKDQKFIDTPDVTEYQFNSIYNSLKEIRNLYPKADLVSLEQIEKYIEHNPSANNSILQILQRNGYFDIWVKEKELCAYLYDKKTFKDFWDEDSASQALSVIRDSKRIISDKINAIRRYQCLEKSVGELDYYNAMITLCENLIICAEERINVAYAVLQDLRIVRIALPKFKN